jgi:hypothetical protein
VDAIRDSAGELGNDDDPGLHVATSTRRVTGWATLSRTTNSRRRAQT